MQRGRRVFLGGAGALALLAVPACAMATSATGTAPVPFSDAAFDAAQKAGRLVLVDIYATWCIVCARQGRIIDALLADPAYKDLVVFKVNFDTQKDVMRRFGASVQSTLIAYRGTKEVGRSVAETQIEWVEDMLSKARSSAS